MAITDQWVVDEARERFDKLIYTMAHLDPSAGTYMKVQYIKRITDQYIDLQNKGELPGAGEFMATLLDSLHEMASCMETWLPKADDD